MANETELSRYRRVLEDRRDTILGVREHHEAEWQAVHERPVEFEESAQHEHLGRPLEAIDRRARDELDAITAAIGRIDAGTFGICLVCGTDISPERLEALPWTPLCIDCARDEARDQRVAQMESSPPAMFADRAPQPTRRPRPGPKTDVEVAAQGEDTSQDPWGIERESGTAMEPADRLVPESKR